MSDVGFFLLFSSRSFHRNLFAREEGEEEDAAVAREEQEVEGAGASFDVSVLLCVISPVNKQMQCNFTCLKVEKASDLHM